VSTIQSAIVEWDRLWSQGSSLFNEHGSGTAREALELLLGVLLYQRWSLAGFEEADFHLTIRANPPGKGMADLARGDGDPLSDRHHVGAGMHLASASIRLPLATSLLIEAVPEAKAAAVQAFDDLYTRTWSRERACRYLGTVQNLGHCSVGLTPASAIVTQPLLRDEFSHGEEGEDEKHWYRSRKDATDALYRCEVVQAQQLLTKWSFQRLAANR
jgi:hypothetical protein